MRLSDRNRREYARNMLWTHREDYWPHLMQHGCVVKGAVRVACDTAGWDFHTYVTAVAFDAPWLLDGAE